MITQDWQILPVHNTQNKNAVFFAISDDYSFAVANILMGLNKHSEALMKTVDVLIYHNGLSEKNRDLLRSLHKNTYFMPMQFPPEWADMLEHPKTAQWGAFVLCKFFGFELIKKYEKVLHLDADMHVCADIAELFQLQEEIAFRSVVAWDPNEVFAPLLSPGTRIRCGNGGLFLFTEKLAPYAIDTAAIQEAFLKTKDLPLGGVDETVIAWLVYKRGMRLKEVDIALYNTPSIHVTPATRLVHFLSSYAISSKPWENPASYVYYNEWAQNYHAWLDSGGEGLVHFSREDYYRLFGYDKAVKIRKLNTTLAKVREENEAYRSEIERQREEIAALDREKEALDDEIKRLKGDLSKQERRLKAVLGSKSWRFTRPFRQLSRFGKRLFRGNLQNKK